MENKKIVLSGIRATGILHIGNYLGAVKGMLELQDNPKYETYFMVADAHAITTPYDKKTLIENRKSVVLDYLSAGLDPSKSVLFVQSMVPAHFELSHYLSSVISVSRMQHLPTYKEKIKQSNSEASVALLNYPVLMAADILAYKASDVPVGIDQEPHLEIARLIARKMNQEYDTDFPEPSIFKTTGSYIPSLLGEGKMSKSVAGSYISIRDSLEEIKNALSRVPTDSGKGDLVPDKGGVSNLLEFVSLFQGADMRLKYEEMYKSSGIRYSDLKDSLAKSIYEYLEPLQKQRDLFKDIVDDVIAEGTKKAKMKSEETLTYVKEKMGFI